MFRCIVFLICFPLVNFLGAQSISPSVISNGGDVMKSGNFSIEWTLGEIVVETFKNGSSILTQGFHQGKLSLVATSNPTLEGIDVYPNPVSSILYIDNKNEGNFKLQIISLNGSQIQEKELSTGTTEINMEQLPYGMYLFKIQNENKIQTYQIEKIK